MARFYISRLHSGYLEEDCGDDGILHPLVWVEAKSALEAGVKYLVKEGVRDHRREYGEEPSNEETEAIKARFTQHKTLKDLLYHNHSFTDQLTVVKADAVPAMKF